MSEVIKLLAKAPPGAIEAIVSLIRAILADEDPERAAKSAVAKLASETAARKVLG